MDPLTGILLGAGSGLLSGFFDNSDDVAQAQIDAANQGYAAQAAALEKQQALQKAVLLLTLMQQQQQGPLGFGAQLAGNQAGLDISTQLYNDQMRQDIPNRIAQLGAYPALGTMASMLGLPAYEFPTSFELSQIQTPNLMDMTRQGAAGVQQYFNFDPKQIAQLLSDPNGFLSSILSGGSPTPTTAGTAPVAGTVPATGPSMPSTNLGSGNNFTATGNTRYGPDGKVLSNMVNNPVYIDKRETGQIPWLDPKTGADILSNGDGIYYTVVNGKKIPYLPDLPGSNEPLVGDIEAYRKKVRENPSGFFAGGGTQPTIPSTVAPTARAPQTISLVPKQYEFDVTKTPGYQFRADAANKRADAELAARGLSGSGVGMRFRADTASNLAGQEFDKQLTRLQNYFNTAMGRSVSTPTAAGQGIAGNVSQAGQNLSSAFNTAANSRTSAIQNTAGNLSGMIGTQGQLGATNAYNLGQIGAQQAQQPGMFQQILQGGLYGLGMGLKNDPFSNWR